MNDIAIIGAGAAGLTAAIFAASKAQGKQIILFDSRLKIGAKILISGGTRCNVTHAQVLPTDYQGGAQHFIKHVLEAFPPSQTMEFFQRIGVPLILEPTGKYFPVTYSGRTVLEALIKETTRLGVKLITGVRIVGIKKEEGGFQLAAENQQFFAKRGISAVAFFLIWTNKQQPLLQS